MTRPSLKERQRQLREDAILDAALELLAEEGYTEMSMDALAARVGVSKATLYQHFASKDELAIRVIVRLIHRTIDDLMQLDPALPAMVRLRSALRTSMERRISLSTSYLSLMPNSVTAHPLYRDEYIRMTRMFAEFVDLAKEQGDIDPQLSTPVIVYMVASAL